jgi:hypothetical protein
MTFSWTLALVFSMPDLAEAPMLAAVSLMLSPVFFDPPCIFLDFSYLLQQLSIFFFFVTCFFSLLLL